MRNNEELTGTVNLKHGLQRTRKPTSEMMRVPTARIVYTARRCRLSNCDKHRINSVWLFPNPLLNGVPTQFGKRLTFVGRHLK